jgi:sec-independent protein translocase protein TatC
VEAVAEARATQTKRRGQWVVDTVLMYMLAKLRIANARREAGFWRFAVILIMAAAAVITPTPDSFNMMIVASPLLALYGLGLLLARTA